VVVGQGGDLDPVQAADHEAVVAQDLDDVGAQMPATTGREQDQADLRVAVVQVDSEEYGLAGQVAGGQLDHGKADHSAMVLGLPVRRAGGAGRHRHPGTAGGAGSGVDVGEEFGLEGLDIAVGLGPQPGQLSA
jgi:hypothetical protein